MSRVISTTVYLSDELSESARKKARAWYCEGGLEYEWYDAVYEDFTLICNILGVRLKTRIFTTTGGRSYEKACIWFSGFCCQGDGACFEGLYHYQPVPHNTSESMRLRTKRFTVLLMSCRQSSSVTSGSFRLIFSIRGAITMNTVCTLLLSGTPPPVRKPPMTQTVSWVTRYAIWPAGYISNLKRNTTG